MAQIAAITQRIDRATSLECSVFRIPNLTTLSGNYQAYTPNPDFLFMLGLILPVRFPIFIFVLIYL